MSIFQFTQKIQSKILNIDSYVDFHDKKVDDFIDQIIEQASRIKEQFKKLAQQKYKYCMLSQNQRKIFSKLKQNDVADMKGLFFIQLFQEMDQNNKIQYENLNQEQLKKIQEAWSDVQKKCSIQFQNLKQLLINKIFVPIQKNNFNLNFRKSNIVKSQQEKIIIKNFFNKKIKKVNLLYKASQNDFKLQKFYQNCTNIPNTLTLIQTEFNKKIGGFTPLCWKKAQKVQKFPDKTNSSFIFSLSNNQKFKQIDLNSGISNDKNYGPYFSGSTFYDIIIVNQGNINNCESDFNCCYINNNYKQKNAQTHKRFSGNSNN